MKDKILKIKDEALDKINKVENQKDLETLRLKYLGKKGELKQILKSIGNLSVEEKKDVGKLSNEAKNEISHFIEEKKAELIQKQQQEQLEKDKIDITLPGRRMKVGKLHPITSLINDIVRIFNKLGFISIDAPQLEDEFHNFDALNIPEHHPARDDQDSFYIYENNLLRTQTSSAQIRIMEQYQPPLAIIHAGRCFRKDALDPTHCHTFHQVEGLLVDKGISMAHLKGMVLTFAKELFGKDTVTRFRPSFFPFTEPSAEVDVSCFICGGKGCRVCKNTGWIELGGSGLVDPEVFKAVGYDPEKYSGWAFGIGIERLAMTKFGIPDIRMLYENDVRFLEQF